MVVEHEQQLHALTTALVGGVLDPLPGHGAIRPGRAGVSGKATHPCKYLLRAQGSARRYREWVATGGPENRELTMMQTLAQAIHLATSGKSRALRSAALELEGKPVGGWPETEQALRQLRADLPLQSEREYTVEDFVDALYTVSGDRYRSNVRAAEVQADEAQAAHRHAEHEAAVSAAFAACPALTVGTTRVELDSDGYVVQFGPELTAEELGAALPAEWLASAKRARELCRRAL